MKLVTFEFENRQRLGAVLSDGKRVVDLQAAAEMDAGKSPDHFASMLSLIEGGDTALGEARTLTAKVELGACAAATRELSELWLLAPLPVPSQMRDFLCFEKHYRQARAQALKIRAATYPDPVAAERDLAQSDEFNIPKIWYEQPVYYKGNRFSVVGSDAPIIWPDYSEKLDFELEFGVVIGKRGKNISREEASEYIFGFCIFNDMTARDAQYKEYPCRLGPAKGKDFDSGNVLGPWLVTKDEVPDPYNLTMVARINGEEWCRESSREMYHKFEDMIVHVSREETIHPGEFFGSGTVGNGCGLERNRWIKPGDVIELEVEGLGVLKNRVVRPSRTDRSFS